MPALNDEIAAAKLAAKLAVRQAQDKLDEENRVILRISCEVAPMVKALLDDVGMALFGRSWGLFKAYRVVEEIYEGPHRWHSWRLAGHDYPRYEVTVSVVGQVVQKDNSFKFYFGVDSPNEKLTRSSTFTLSEEELRAILKEWAVKVASQLR